MWEGTVWAWQAGPGGQGRTGAGSTSPVTTGIGGEAGTSGPNVCHADGCASMSLPSGRPHSREPPSSLHPTRSRDSACDTGRTWPTPRIFQRKIEAIGPQTHVRKPALCWNPRLASSDHFKRAARVGGQGRLRCSPAFGQTSAQRVRGSAELAPSPSPGGQPRSPEPLPTSSPHPSPPPRPMSSAPQL